MTRYIQLVCVLVFTIALGACDEPLSNIAGPTPNLEPTFSSIQRDIFEATDSSGRPSCVTCHTNVGRIPPAGLNLLHDVAYDQIVNRSSVQRSGTLRVAPGNPDGSYLIQKLEGRSIVGLRMPLNGPYLTIGQIEIIKRWIEIGAPNN